MLKSYDFNFSFCIPNSTNEWEAIYDLPRYTHTTQTDAHTQTQTDRTKRA